jgi:hypothetical protein
MGGASIGITALGCRPPSRLAQAMRPGLDPAPLTWGPW